MLTYETLATGTDVVAGQDKIGSLKRVVVDPHTRKVSHLVVEKGWILKRDRVIPIDLVQHVGDDRIDLEVWADEDDFPPFEAERYVSLGADAAIDRYPLVLAHPLGVGAMPVPVPAAGAMRADTQRTVPEDTMAFSDDTVVVDVNDERIGTLTELVFDADERLTHVCVDQGIFGGAMTIPLAWAQNVDEDVIKLVVTKEELAASLQDQQ